jgi:hypothetical protein
MSSKADAEKAREHTGLLDHEDQALPGLDPTRVGWIEVEEEPALQLVFIPISRALLFRIGRVGKWLGAVQTAGGGTRGLGCRPQVPPPSRFCVQANLSVALASQ